LHDIIDAVARMAVTLCRAAMAALAWNRVRCGREAPLHANGDEMRRAGEPLRAGRRSSTPLCRAGPRVDGPGHPKGLATLLRMAAEEGAYPGRWCAFGRAGRPSGSSSSTLALESAASSFALAPVCLRRCPAFPGRRSSGPRRLCSTHGGWRCPSKWLGGQERRAWRWSSTSDSRTLAHDEGIWRAPADQLQRLCSTSRRTDGRSPQQDLR